MQNTTHYLTKLAGHDGFFTVHRKADNAQVGVITKKHRGWESSFCGVRLLHATKAEAFAQLAN